MRLYLYVIFALIAASIAGGCGCTDDAMRLLADAEAIMEENPDSALRILAALHPDTLADDSLPTFGDAKTDALYGLLLTQALTKTNEILTDPSLISRSVDFFERKGDDLHLMKSLFYQGYVNYNAAEYAKAVIPAQQSLEMARNLQDDYWRAKSAELLCDIFICTYNYDEASDFIEDVLRNYENAGKERNHRFSMCDYACIQAERGNFSRGFNIIDSLMALAMEAPTDTSLYVYGAETKIPLLLRDGKYADALKCYEDLSQFDDKIHFGVREYACLAQTLMMLGRVDEADCLIDAIRENSRCKPDSVCLYQTLSIYYDAKGDYKKSKDYTDSILYLQNSALTDILKQSVVSAQRDYYIAASDKEKKKSGRLQLAIILIAAASVVVVLILYWLYRIRIRLKNYESLKVVNALREMSDRFNFVEDENRSLHTALAKKETDIRGLSEKLTVKDEALSKSMHIYKKREDEAKKEMESLFKEKWHTLNMLCREYIENVDLKSNEAIYKNIVGEISKIKSKKSLREIEEAVNKYMGGIMDRLRNQCPFLKEDDYIFISLIYAGFTPAAVAVLTDNKVKNFYNKRTRLIKRIENSEAHDKSLFLAKLKQQVENQQNK